MKQILLLFAFTISFTLAADLMPPTCPVFPPQPTDADCKAYAQDYFAYVNSLDEQLGACLQTGDRPIEIINGHATAYPQCEEIQEKVNEAQEGVNSVYKCNDLARANADSNANSTLDKVTDAAKSLKESYDKLKDARDTLTNPDKFFLKALGDQAYVGILQKNNYALGNQVYKYADDMVKKSRGQLDSVTPPVISGIQQSFLDKLVDIHSNLLQTMDTLNSQIAQASPDCSVLRNPQKSGDLQDSDPDAYLNVDCAIWQNLDSEAREELRERDQASFDAYQKKCGTNQSQ